MPSESTEPLLRKEWNSAIVPMHPTSSSGREATVHAHRAAAHCAAEHAMPSTHATTGLVRRAKASSSSGTELEAPPPDSMMST